jgi:DNA-binding response OmpR family regulator
MKLTIDLEKYLVIKDDQFVELPRKEFEVLQFLSKIPGKVFSRKTIFENIWGASSLSGERTVDVHILNIRKKLGSEVIKTIKGVGYKVTSEDITIKEN